MVERHAFFPDRVPDPARDFVDVAAVAVQEQDVEIASRCRLRTAVSAERDERDVGLVAQETREPAIGETGQGLAQRQALEVLVLTGSPCALR